jgi:hypothetical protein
MRKPSLLKRGSEMTGIDNLSCVWTLFAPHVFFPPQKRIYVYEEKKI